MVAIETMIDAYQQRLQTFANTATAYRHGIAWIDDAYTPIEHARIPLLDQGFLHSDLTYDVPAVWNGRYFRLDDHLDRLEASCRKLRLRMPIDRAALRARLSGLEDAFVEIIVTRGLGFVRGADPDAMLNALYLFAVPYVWAMPPEIQRVGGSAVITRTVRRVPPGAMDPTIKNLQWGDFIRGLFEARDRGAALPILPDGDGNLTEGGGYNLFLVKDGVLFTPERGVLEGVTRRTVLEIAAAHGWTVRIEHVPVDLAYQADEIFLSTTAGGIMPIAMLDGRDVGRGAVGPVTRAVWESYWDLHEDPAYSFPVAYGARARAQA
jgi:branched-subunit amino acid aminotransferase/4-amino-4-deoxychorismate lyase